MANETTYALLTDNNLVNHIREAAFLYARQNFVMPQVVQTYTDMRGMQNRIFNEYSTGTVATGLSEAADLDSERQTFDRSLAGTIAPAEVGTQFFLTDRRIDSDDVVNIAADLAQHINYTVFAQVEGDLAGNMASMTGGTIGAAGSVLQWSDVYKARALLRAAGVPGPYNVVLHEYSYLNLATQANIAGLANAAPLTVRDVIQNNYYIGSSGDMDFYTIGTDGLAAGTNVTTGLFNRQAIGFDVRRPLRIEQERDSSARGWEFNVSMIYAHGVVRPTWGVQLIGDASIPS